MRKLIYYILTLSLSLILTCDLEAATLTVGSNSGTPGGKNIFIPIDLSSILGEKSGGFNFDLNFDTSRLSFKEVKLGPKSIEANKSLSHSQPSSNTIRIVVIGFNQNIIENGTVLNFTFNILNNASTGKAELIIIDPSISDCSPKVNLLPVTTKNGEIIVERSNPETSTTTSANTPTTTPTTVRTTTSTSVQPPIPGDTTTTTSTTDMSTSSTTTINTTSSTALTSSTTTTSISQLWPLLYDKMWGSKKDQNLFLLRAFRDEVLVNTDIGKEYISMLYDNSLEIAILLLQDPLYSKQASEVTNELLHSIESLLYSDEMIISQKTIDNFEFLLNQLEPKASPKLKSVIKKVRKDIKEEIVFRKLGIGISFFRQD